ncbi:MAG: tetratricopeptide repeat protein [Candidatus Schekmanbacteria bacterium]|nr:tetratricopeptide repeat protein [Candidatus Schekmanbacteria bacterium]
MEKKKYLILAAVAFVAVVAYFNSLNVPFIWDDENLVLFNYYLHNPFSFKDYFISNAIPQRPVSVLIFVFDYQLYGVYPEGYHITQILLHAFVSVMVSYLAFSFCKDNLFALLSGLLFAIHPVHTEAVDLLLGRSDIVVTLFLLLSFLCYRSFLQLDYSDKGKQYYALSVILFILALFSKETAVIFPIVLLSFCYLQNNEDWRCLFKRSRIVPFLICTACYLLFWFTIAFSNSVLFDVRRTPFQIKPYGGSFLKNYLLQVETFGRYLELLLFPVNLRVWYEPYLAINPFSYIVSLILIGGFVTLIIFTKDRMLKFFSLWILLGILPVLNIIPIPGSMIAERWIYFASVGCALFFARLLSPAFSKFQKNITRLSEKEKTEPQVWDFNSLLKRYGIMFAVLIVCLLFIILTITRNNVYKSEISFYDDLIHKEPKAAILSVNYAMALIKKGNAQKGAVLLENYISKGNRKFLDQAYSHLGIAYERLGKRDLALKCYEEAVRINRKSVFSLINLGTAYLNKNDLSKSRKYLDAAILLEPLNSDVNYNYGMLLDASSDYIGAIERYKLSIKYRPDYADVHNNLGLDYYRTGMREEAKKEFKIAITISPDYYQAYGNIGILLFEDHDFKGAAESFNKVLSINPSDQLAKDYLRRLESGEK